MRVGRGHGAERDIWATGGHPRQANFYFIAIANIPPGSFSKKNASAPPVPIPFLARTFLQQACRPGDQPVRALSTPGRAPRRRAMSYTNATCRGAKRDAMSDLRGP